MAPKYTLLELQAAASWLNSRCEIDDHILCKVKEAFEDYTRYTEKNPQYGTTVSKHKFASLVIAAVERYKNKTITRARKKELYFYGLGLKPAEQENTEPSPNTNEQP